MTYKIYYTDAKLPKSTLTPDFSRLMPLSCETQADAIEIAFKIINQKGVVWQIDGPDELLIDRPAIAMLYEKQFGRRIET